MKLKLLLASLVIFSSCGAVFVVLSPTTPAEADPSCTDGVDCYCDKVTDSGHAYYDSDLLFCEDFEAATLYEDLAAGNWCIDNDGSGGGRAAGDTYQPSPVSGSCDSGDELIYGAWWDTTGGSSAWRGLNSYWRKTFSYPTGNYWPNNYPTSPQRGATCTAGGNGCDTPVEYHPDDLWDHSQVDGRDDNGIDRSAAIDIQRAGDINDEITDLNDPQVPGKHSGIFDGRQHLAHRIYAGDVSSITGASTWSTVYEVGLTMAVAYPTNLDESNINDAFWKHNEFQTADYPAYGLGMLLFGESGGYSRTVFPFYHYISGDIRGGDCSSALSGATVHVGYADCAGTLLRYWPHNPDSPPASPLYKWTVDWDVDEWACARAHYTGMNTGSMEIKIWFNDTLVIHISGLDGSEFDTYGGITGYLWDSYSNMNQSGDPTTETTYRYEDNLHMTNGTPVSCSQIGF